MNRVFLELGNFKIYWYSIMILLGVLVASYVILKEAKRNNMKDYIENIIFYALIIGIIGARLYYVIFYEESYNLISVLEIWNGGLAIYGGIIAGLITVIYLAKKYKQSILKTTDILVPGLIIAQSIGRWGNFFNKEAYGPNVSLSFLHKLHIPNFIIEGMNIGGKYCNPYCHPTFLYESIWCLLGFIVLLIIRKISNRKKGILTYTYFIWYGVGRFFIEALRTDSLYIGNFKVSQVVSIILIIIGIIGIINSYIKKEVEK